MKKAAFFFLLLCLSASANAQGTLSGDFMMNFNSFQRDTNIRASGNPLYNNYLSGSEAWLDLRYSIKGYTFFLRGDVFNNSNLKNPTSASTDFGVGAWSITKEMQDLTITVGSIYDQIGSGILFRAYEDRGLLIDNALIGLQLKYRIAPNIMLKGFTGQQKNNSILNDQINNKRYAPVIKGFNAEGDFSTGKLHLLPGIGILNRTLDQDDYTSIYNNEKLLASANKPFFTPVYNMYAFAAYNTLTYKNFSWYAEGDYKTREAIQEATLVNKPGNVEYTTLSYGKKGLAVSLMGKRTQDFVMRTSPSQILLNGILNWQPVLAVLRPERLISRYTPASQDISEQAGSVNVILSPTDVANYTFTYTNINTLDKDKLYREVYGEAYYQGLKSWIFQGGVQYLEYNLQTYYGEPKNAPVLFAVTPFAEATYRFTEKKSLRAELQYMNTKQDYGSWIFALLEYDVAPKWSVSISDMYNITPNNNSDNPTTDNGSVAPKQNHYYNLFVAYTKGANRFSIAYVKQVDGINCTGGVCRYEPAFSGVKATITSSF